MKETRADTRAALLQALGLHVVLFATMFAGLQWTRSNVAEAAQGEVIEADLIDPTTLGTAMRSALQRTPEALPQLNKLARLAGYRFVLLELTHPATVKRGADIGLKMKWANVGVGKLYRPFKLHLSLLDAAGLPVVNFEAKADPRDWLPGERDLVASIPLPAAVKPGSYTLAVALMDPTGQRPPLRLAMDAPEQDGHYNVTKIKVD